MDFKVNGEYIELKSLLKATGLVPSGGEAGFVIESGMVKVNGETESRKRKKIRTGDQVEFNSVEISII